MGSTLLDIGTDLRALSDLLDEAGGELTPDTEAAIERWFAELGEAKNKKLDGYACLIRQCELRAAVRKEERERLDKLVQADANLAKRLKDRLLWFMQAGGESKIETDRYRLRVQSNGGKLPVEVVGLGQLPDGYLRMTYEADLDKLRDDLVAGKEIPGAVLKPRGVHLRIE